MISSDGKIRAVRLILPATRHSVTHRFAILVPGGTIDGYIIVGLYEDGTPAELFLVLAKSGETLSVPDYVCRRIERKFVKTPRV